jgi:hypothetical protein
MCETTKLFISLEKASKTSEKVLTDDIINSLTLSACFFYDLWTESKAMKRSSSRGKLSREPVGGANR